MRANGYAVGDLLIEFPSLTRDDIMACLDYAAGLAGEQITPAQIAGVSRMTILVDENIPPMTVERLWEARLPRGRTPRNSDRQAAAVPCGTDPGPLRPRRVSPQRLEQVAARIRPQPWWVSPRGGKWRQIPHDFAIVGYDRPIGG